MIARLKAWLARRRAHRASVAALAEIIAAVDALEGTYVILLNGYPVDPGQGFRRGDRIEIRFVDVPDHEIEMFERMAKLFDATMILHEENPDA